jgi:6,7-dimethyl-8-ribityllumazine synthase
MEIKQLEGFLNAKGVRVAIVAARFNDFITNKLVDGAVDSYVRHNGNLDDLIIAKVPGAFEIPLACQKLAKTEHYDAIVALGAVIRGATPHFDYVSSEVTKGIAQVSLKNDLPIAFGILTTDSIEQAIERAGSKAGNKGSEAMNTIIEMVDLYKKIV